MDGTISILDSKAGKQLVSQKAHSKYVVRALWAPHGNHVISVSWDGSVSISGLENLLASNLPHTCGLQTKPQCQNSLAMPPFVICNEVRTGKEAFFQCRICSASFLGEGTEKRYDQWEVQFAGICTLYSASETNTEMI